MHVNTNFNPSFPFGFYTCSCYIFRKFGSFLGYLSLSSVTLMDGNKETLKMPLYIGKATVKKLKKVWSHIKGLIHQF